jgi:Ca2+-binding EF-hand superfamily protein
MAQTYKTGLIITGDASGGIRAIKATEDELGKLNQRFDRGARQSKQFGSDASRAGQQLREIDTGANDASRGLEVLRSNVVGVAAAMATAFGANSIIQQSRIIADTDALAQSIGIATSELQAWDYAAQQAGFAGGQMGDILKDITEKIGEFTAEGTGEAAALFENLNLNIEEMKRLSPDQQLLRISEAISTLETRGEKISYLERLGNDATRLLPLLDNNAALLREYTNEAQALGVAMSQVDIENAVQANRAMAQLSGTIDGFKNQIAADLGPGLAEAVGGLTELIQEMGGASVIIGQVADGATVLAAIMAGRYAAAFATSATNIAANIAATYAQAQADVAATAAARAKAAETLRVALSEQAAAKRAAENARAIAAATGNTALRTKAINQMAAANQRAIGAEAAHTAAVNASSAAMARSTVAAQGMSVAARAGASAYAMLGGPLGLLVGAGGLLYAFREEIGLVRQTVEPTTERIDNLTDAINRNSVAAVEAGIVNLSAEYFTLGQRAAATTAQIERLNAAQENDRQGAQARLQNNMRLRDLREELAQIVTEQEAAGEASTRLRETLEGLGETAVPTTSSLTDLGDATETAAAKAQAHADAAEAQASALEELRNRLIPGRRETVQLARDTNTLALATAMFRGNTAQLLQMMGLLQKEFIEAQRETENLATASEDASQRIANSFLSWETVADNTLRRIDDSGQGLWLGLTDGSESALDTVKRGFQQTLAEIAHMLTTQKLTFQVAGMMGLDTTGMPGGGGFNLNSLGSLSNIGRTVSGWFGGGAAAGAPPIGYASGFGAQAATGTYTGWAGSAAAGAANPGMLASMGGFSGIASGLGAGYMGYQLGQSLAPDAKYGKVAGGLGALGGFALGGPIGAAIGGAIVPAISKGLFGGSWQTKDAGLQLGVSSGDFVGNQYERQRKSGGLFSGSSYRTRTSALGAELDSSLSQAYEAQEASLALTLDVLGQQSIALNAFSTGLTKISTKGKSEAEIEQAVQEWLQGIVNRAAQSVVDPSDFALAGETTVDTLNRLATALTGVNPIMEQLHGNAFAASLAGGDAAASLVALSGGMDLFTQRADYYYQNFYSETERQQAAMDQAAQAMGAFTAQTGKIVTSADQLRDLVDGIDRNTQSGRELYAAAMQLAPALMEVENGLERVRGRFADMLSDAENALSSAEQQARSAYAAFEKQSFDQQLQLLGLLGDEQAALALQRERELQGFDPLLQETQRRIWAMEDEAAAQQDATRAGQEYARSLAQVNNQLSSTFNGISQWVDQQSATAGTPGMNLTEAGDQFARQLVLAQSGDRNALQSITQYAEQYLAAGEAMYASGGEFQRIQGDVLDALKDLPDQISAEEYIAEEVKQALREQTQGISTQLGDVLRGDNPSNIAGNLAGYFTTLAGGIDGVLTREQLAIVMSGKATDAELQAIMRAVDLNGDGVINGLESVVIAGMPTDAVLGTVLRNKMNELDKNQLTHAQVRNALSPIAKQGQINQLINRADRNADGIITAQELANASLDGLASGIGSALYPMFDSLDSSLDGLIDYAEFASAFEGMATDAQLRELFNMLDANGDGQLSKLEALEQSSEGTEGNTKTMEERAREQLSKLVQLSQEMTRTTDQFVGLNSTMVSLKDSITALGVAQEEVARIEQERLAAEKAERERIERERVEAQRGSLASEIDRLQREQQSLANTGVSAPSRSVINSSYRHVPDAINNINRIVDSILGSSGVTDRSVERLRDYYTQGPGFTADQGVGDAPGAGGAYSPGGLYWPYVEAYLREIESAIDTRQSATSLDSEIARLRAELNKLNSVDGSHATGLWNVPFDGYIAELHRDEMVVPAQTAGRLRELPSRELPMPALPNFPLLNRTDQHDVVRDLLNENKTLRKELTALLKRIEQHGAAGVAVQQEAAKQQISELKKSNLALDDMSAAARLEALR